MCTWKQYDATAATSEGQRLLMLLTSSQSVTRIAQRIYATRVAVHYWMTGRSVPSYAMRARLAMSFAIPESAWNKKPSIPTVSTC